MLAGVIILFCVVYGLMGLFCASKKPLAMGLPMARVIFGS
jgi:hypothetical protein